MGKLILTPKGKKYIAEQKAKSPEMAALCKKIGEVIPSLPTDRKAIVDTVYDTAAMEHTKKKQVNHGR